MAKEKLEEIKEIDLILGNNEKKNIVKYVERYIGTDVGAMLRRCPGRDGALPLQTKNIHSEDVMHQEEFVDFGTTLHIEKTRAVIKVQDGCDRFCSYCIIPYARGRVRSRKIESITEEVKKLSKNDVKEIVVTGIHIASYGKDFKENIGLINLLEEINKIEGIERIRLGSLEPTIITNKFLNRLSRLEKVCHHFHLSLQSGCNETLQRMNRKYTIEEFKEVVTLLRKTYEDVVLTTDIIVGFPGETEEEFEITYKNLEEINFYKMHIFKYSRRQGTKADKMENQISPNIKEERSKKLIKLSNKNQLEYNKKLLNEELEVLFEEKDGVYIKGHTANYIVVKVKENNIEKYHNKIEKVIVREAENEDLIGNMIM